MIAFFNFLFSFFPFFFFLFLFLFFFFFFSFSFFFFFFFLFLFFFFFFLRDYLFFYYANHTESLKTIILPESPNHIFSDSGHKECHTSVRFPVSSVAPIFWVPNSD